MDAGGPCGMGIASMADGQQRFCFRLLCVHLSIHRSPVRTLGELSAGSAPPSGRTKGVEKSANPGAGLCLVDGLARRWGPSHPDRPRRVTPVMHTASSILNAWGSLPAYTVKQGDAGPRRRKVIRKPPGYSELRKSPSQPGRSRRSGSPDTEASISSLHSDPHAPHSRVAQSVERRTVNAVVAGSTPAPGASFAHVAQE